MELPQKKNSALFNAIIIIQLVIISFAILINLDADFDTKTLSGIFFLNIDSHIHGDAFYYGDEGWHAGNAINKSITGNWICDYWNDGIIYPVIPLIQYALFSIGGASILAMRLPSALLSIALIFFGLFMLKARIREDVPEQSYKAMVLFLALIGVNQYFLVHARIALLEIPMSAFGSLGLLLIYSMIKSSNIVIKITLSIVASFLFTLSIFTKSAGVQFILCLFIFLVLYLITNKHVQKKINILLVSGTIALCIVLSFVILAIVSSIPIPDRSYLSGIFVRRIDFNVFKIAYHYIKFFANKFLLVNMILVLSAFACIISITIKYIKTKKASIVDILMVSWIFASYLFIGFFSLQEDRYFMVLMIPLAYFTSTLIPRATEFFRKELKAWMKMSFVALLLLGNAVNIVNLFDYHLNYTYNLRNIAIEVQSDIRTLAGKNENEFHGGIASLLAVTNHLKFYYRIDNAVKPVYLFSHYPLVTEEDLRSVSDTAKFKKMQLVKTYMFNNRNSDGEAGYLYKVDP
jgi:4-amino-4-deoxy-L-arabinose transferase-like glycosyltransferase